jgi:hypothetical protein
MLGRITSFRNVSLRLCAQRAVYRLAPRVRTGSQGLRWTSSPRWSGTGLARFSAGRELSSSSPDEKAAPVKERNEDNVLGREPNAADGGKSKAGLPEAERLRLKADLVARVDRGCLHLRRSCERTFDRISAALDRPSRWSGIGAVYAWPIWLAEELTRGTHIGWTFVLLAICAKPILNYWMMVTLVLASPILLLIYCFL